MPQSPRTLGFGAPEPWGTMFGAPKPWDSRPWATPLWDQQDLLAHKALKVQQVHKDLQVVLVLVLQWKVKLLRQVTYNLQATQKVMLI